MAKSKKTPQNKVGHKVPTPQETEQLLAQIRGAKQFAAELGPRLSPAERKRVTRPRRGGEAPSNLILRLAAEHGVRSRLLSVEDAQRDASLFKAIESATLEAFDLWQTLRDVYMQARGEHWDATLAYYGTLDSMSETDPELFGALTPAVEFFAQSPQDGDDAADAEDAENGLD